jgi:ubiquinone biosynthesis protein
MRGDEVAVKVLRPQIESSFASDLSLFEWIAKNLENYIPWTQRLQPIKVVQIFANTIALEMDMRMEAAAAAELAENFKGDPDFKVPKIFWETTTKRVLTLERLSG